MEDPLLHEQHNQVNRTEDHGKGLSSWVSADFVKSIVYAGLDAIVTCFALISSISGGHLSSVDVLVLGISNLVADGISMGFSDFLSSSAEMEMAAKERKSIKRKMTSHAQPELMELLDTYRALGMTHQDAQTVVSIFSKYEEILVDEKMAAEKGMVSPAEGDQKPWKNGLVTFAAFLFFGSAPLLSYIVMFPFTDDQTVKFSGACVLSGAALALLGAAKAKVSGGNYVVSVSMTLCNGVVAATAAYLIGWALRDVAALAN